MHPASLTQEGARLHGPLHLSVGWEQPGQGLNPVHTRGIRARRCNSQLLKVAQALTRRPCLRWSSQAQSGLVESNKLLDLNPAVNEVFALQQEANRVRGCARYGPLGLVERGVWTRAGSLGLLDQRCSPASTFLSLGRRLANLERVEYLAWTGSSCLL